MLSSLLKKVDNIMTIDDLMISENSPDDVVGEIEGLEDTSISIEKFNPNLYQNYINRLKDSEGDLIDFEELEWIPPGVVAACGGLKFTGKLTFSGLKFTIKKEAVDSFLKIMDYIYNS